MLKHRLVIVEYSKFWFHFNLESIVSAWMIHVMGSSREQREEDIVISHTTKLFHVTFIKEDNKVLNHISCMDLRMVKVPAIRHLKSIGKILELLESKTWDLTLPVKFLMSVHKGEVKKVASGWLINRVGIIVEALKVLVKVRQLWLILVLVSSVNTLLG